MRNWRNSVIYMVKGLGLTGMFSLAACGTVPDSMHVRDGIAPANIDKEVRFRTTYYFRVYDFCYNANSRAQLQPVTDSLFRFVMTGKANAYANRVRFESGTLKASQIDPFGATVEQDKETGRLRFVSEREVQTKARMNNAIKDIEALIELKERLINMNKTSKEENGRKLVADKTITAIDTQISQFISARLSEGKLPAGTETVPSDFSAGGACPENSEIQRGFQVMGPQGVKTFNQEERLLMAMSSDAKPLLASLSEVSGRYLAAKEEQQAVSELLLPLVREQLLVSRIKREELEHDKADDVEQLYKGVKGVLNINEPENDEADSQ